MIETKTYPENGVQPPHFSFWQKINPIWWMQNVEGVDATYKPDWPAWQRQLFWFFRNFMWNFFNYVIGVGDRVLRVTGPAPVFTPVWCDCIPPTTGFKWSVIRTAYIVFLPFISYSGTNVIWYLGWMPSGGRLGIKFNLVK